MGKRVTVIEFAAGVPSFSKIQSVFFKQTGLYLSLQAGLHISSLTTDSAAIARLLQKDADEVERLEKGFRHFCKNNSENYEGQALFRDTKYINKLNTLNRIDFLYFHITGFYELFFQIEQNKIIIDSFAGQYYSVAALENTLIELGGQFEIVDGQQSVGLQSGARKLKPWRQYKWYNRPRK